ncbi:hypothetical protein D6745_00995 [Candidatus Woesearchaeota archaeon]|nr:MAG: hypothetical protein D6745_00995 [Candidatus Woesearchaeota archaeon]
MGSVLDSAKNKRPGQKGSSGQAHGCEKKLEAHKDKGVKMAEKTFNIPLRKEFQKSPKYKRAKKAVSAVRMFLRRHMKSENIKIGPHLNEALWKHGIKNPPHHVKVNALKTEDNVVKVELVGFPIEEKKEEDKKKKEKKKESGLEGAVKEPEKPAEKTPEKKEESGKEAKPEKALHSEKEEKPAQNSSEQKTEIKKNKVKASGTKEPAKNAANPKPEKESKPESKSQ